MFERIAMRILIKWFGFQGRRHKERERLMVQKMHDNGLGA